MGTRDMLSTPPPTTSSCAPLATPMAAKFTACSPEPQKRFRLTPPTCSGQSAASTAFRATLAPCSPTCDTAPATTSSTSAVSMPVRSASATSVWASNSCGCTPVSDPLPILPRPRGVRTASMMYAVSAMVLVPLVA